MANPALPSPSSSMQSESGVDTVWYRFFDGLLRAVGGSNATVIDENRIIRLRAYTVATLPTMTVPGMAFASNGRKNGEGAGLGTGVMVFHDGTAWRACDTGATVAA